MGYDGFAGECSGNDLPGKSEGTLRGDRLTGRHGPCKKNVVFRALSINAADTHGRSVIAPHSRGSLG